MLNSTPVFRPLGLPGFGSVYPTDDSLVKSIKEWFTNGVLLGGSTHKLDVPRCSLFQIASQSPFYQKYGAWIVDRDLLQRIVDESKILVADEQQEAFREWLSCNTVRAGLLSLKKVVRHRPGGSKKKGFSGASPHRFGHGGFYRLILFNEKLHPFAVVVAGGILDAYYVDTVDSDPPGRYFPAADEAIFTWHELAEALGVANQGWYLVASIRAATRAGRLGDMVRVEATEVAAGGQRTVFARQWGDGWFLDDNRFANVLSGADASRTFTAVKTIGGPNSDVVTAGLPFKPMLARNSFEELVVVEALRAAGLQDDVRHIGGGYFLLKHAQFLLNPAADGAWGSLPELPIELDKIIGGAIGGAISGALAGAIKKWIAGLTASTNLILAGFFASLFSAWNAVDSWLEIDEAQREWDEIRGDCLAKPSEQECIDCAASPIEELKNARTHGITAGVAGAVGAGLAVAGAALAWNPVGWVILAVAAIIIGVTAAAVGITAAVKSQDVMDDIYEGCQTIP